MLRIKRKILITGANGLLGRNTLEVFRNDFDIHALVHKAPKHPIHGVSYYEIDFNSEWNTESLPDDIFAVFHLAQSELFREFPYHALDVFNVNLASTAKLLDFARIKGIKKFIFTSTGGIYDTSVGIVNENSPINTFGQLGNYFATKICSEILTHNYTDYFDVTILRLFFMYGKGQKRGMLIPRLVDNIKNGKPITLTENGGIVLNPIHVSDVVQVLKNLLSTNGSFTYNVAGPEQLSLQEIAYTIAEKIGKKPNFEYLNKTADNCLADIGFLESRVFRPITRFKDKIEELL